MKHVVRVICLMLAVVMTAGALLCGCEKKVNFVAPNRYVDYDLTTYVKLGQYVGVEMESYPYELTDESVQQQIQVALSNYAEQKEKTDAIQLGDQAVIDFTGFMDGETFAGGAAQDYTLGVGSGSFIPGFEEGLVGAKTGDTVTLDLNFPDPYTVNPDLAGKPVRFEVTIKKVFTHTLPEYTDAFVMQYYGYATIAEFEAALRESMEKEYEYYKEYHALSQVWESILENSEIISYPETEYNTLYNQYVTTYTEAAKNASMSFDEFLAEAEGMTESDFYAAVDEAVKNELREELILYCIAQVEDITLTQEEYDVAVQTYMDNLEYTSREEFFSHYGEEKVIQNAFSEKVFDFLLNGAVTKNTAQ
jgi:trigger factor